jgi:hypothetical protein
MAQYDDRVAVRWPGQPSSNYTGYAATQDLAHTLSDPARSLQQKDNLDDTLNGIVTPRVIPD